MSIHYLKIPCMKLFSDLITISSLPLLVKISILYWYPLVHPLNPIISASTSENLFENVNASSPSNTYSFPFVPFLISTLYKSLLEKLNFAPVTRRIRTFNEWHNKAANLFQDLLLCVQLWKTAGIPFFCGTSANLLIELRLRGASFCVAACRLL